MTKFCSSSSKCFLRVGTTVSLESGINIKVFVNDIVSSSSSLCLFFCYFELTLMVFLSLLSRSVDTNGGKAVSQPVFQST